MSKMFRSCSLDQPFLLPPSLHEWLPESHLARFIADVSEQLDLGEIYAAYEERDGRGMSAYHPLLMTRLLLYGYCVGIFSSRKLEQATYDQVPVRYLAADQHPDHDTIAAFRQEHLDALSRLFIQTLRLCQKAGLVRLGHVAIDGTKVNANASTRRSLTYDKLSQNEEYWKAKVEELLEQARNIDDEDDRQFGKGSAADSLPSHLAQAEERLQRIQQAKRELEEEARRALEQAQAEYQPGPGKGWRGTGERLSEASRREHDIVENRIKRARKLVEKPTRQYNLTDPDSRVMRDGGLNRFGQCYNAQLGVDGQAQVIVAAAVTQETVDRHQLRPMLELTKESIGSFPETVTADAGYWNTGMIEKETRCELLVCPDATGPFAGNPKMKNNSIARAMRDKLLSERGKAIYRLRRTIVEPVFGQIKECRRFRRFSFRGLAKIAAEWSLVCLTHNLLKLFRYARPLPA